MKILKLILGLLAISYLILFGFSENKSVYEKVIYIIIFLIIIFLNIKNLMSKNKS
jgi:high-affinity K+ transport system ATPase subunit B